MTAFYRNQTYTTELNAPILPFAAVTKGTGDRISSNMTDLPRVLIVDDDAHLRQALEVIIGDKNFHPIPVPTGKQALEIVAEEDIQIALIDLKLHSMDGLEVLRRIRKCSPYTECILLTAHASRSSAITAANQGAYSYIEKPFEMDELLLTLRRAEEKRAAEEALRLSEERNRAILSALPDILFRLDAEAIFLDCRCNNPNLLFLPPEEFIGKKAGDVLPPFLAEWTESHTRKTLESGEMQVFTYALPIEDEQHYFEARMVVSGEDEVLAVIRDITDRVRAEQATQERQVYLEALLSAAPDAIITLDPDNHILEWNQGAEHLFGYTQEEVIGENIDDLIVGPEHTKEAHCFTNHVARGNELKPVETVRVRKDGSPVHVIVAGSPIVIDEQFAGVVAVYTDITERVQVEQAVRHQARSLEALVEISKKFVSTLELETIFQAITNGVVELVNLDSAAIYLVEKETLHLKATTPPLRPNTKDKYRQAHLNVHPQIKETLDTAKAKLLPDIEDADLTAAEKKITQERDLRSILYLPIQIRDSTIGVLIVASCGQPREISQAEIDLCTMLSNQAAMALDNARLYEKTRQHAQELKYRVAKRTAQLEQSNQDLEAFAYSVSHDLRSPLRHIDGFTNMLAEQIDPKSKSVERYFNKIQQASARMHNLINALLTYSRLGRRDLNYVTIPVNEIVERVIQNYQFDLNSREISWQIGPLGVVHADPDMLEIVFDNLIANAIKFTSQRETAEIEISSEQRDNFVEISVRDNGVGFDMAYAHKLFGVFQRLHNDDEFPGTGIGLAIVKRIVQDHNGKVRAQGEIGQGATFTVTLPRGEMGTDEQNPDG
jgi:PAS domain S-box-containing protein